VIDVIEIRVSSMGRNSIRDRDTLKIRVSSITETVLDSVSHKR